MEFASLILGWLSVMAGMVVAYRLGYTRARLRHEARPRSRDTVTLRRDHFIGEHR